MEAELLVIGGDIDGAARDRLEQQRRRDGLAVDLETTGLSPQDDRIQVASLAVPGLITVVPLERGTVPWGICQLLAASSILKILHSATFDVGFIRSRFDISVEPVFCTKVAARLADVDRNPNLALLVGGLLGMDLSKEHQRSDWAARPLSPDQIAYAAADVRHLHDLRTLLERRLVARGRWTLFEACMRFLNSRAELGLMGLDDVFAHDLGGEMAR